MVSDRLSNTLSGKIKSVSYVCWVLLFGCAKPNDYQYLMEHPKQLKEVYLRCQALSQAQSTADTECVAAEKAYDDFGLLFEQSLQNPQLFGLKILNTQVELGKAVERQKELKQSLLQIQQSVATPEPAALAEAQTKYQQAEQATRELHDEVKRLLAVIKAQRS